MKWFGGYVAGYSIIVGRGGPPTSFNPPNYQWIEKNVCCMLYSHFCHLQILKNRSFRTWPFQCLNPTLTWSDQKTASNICILEDPTILIIGGIGFPSTMRPLTHRATKDSYVGSVERQHQDQWVLKDGSWSAVRMSQILQVDLWMENFSYQKNGKMEMHGRSKWTLDVLKALKSNHLRVDSCFSFFGDSLYSFYRVYTCVSLHARVKGGRILAINLAACGI